jgi:hypothetical protein
MGLLCFLTPVKEKVVLRGVPMEPSEPSGLDIDRVRCFRLRDDLFFRILNVGGLLVFGELGTRVVSFDMALLTAGVAGETVKVVSAGLGIGPCGSGALRLDDWWICCNDGTLNSVSVPGCVLLNVAVAAVLGNGGTSARDSLSVATGCSVCGPDGIAERDVSIFSVRAFPDNRLFRTEVASLPTLRGGGVFCDASFASGGWDSATEDKVPGKVGTGGGECAGIFCCGGYTSSATVESDVPPVVL